MCYPVCGMVQKKEPLLLIGMTASLFRGQRGGADLHLGRGGARGWHRHLFSSQLLCTIKSYPTAETVVYIEAAGVFSLSEWSFTICPTAYNRK